MVAWDRNRGWRWHVDIIRGLQRMTWVYEAQASNIGEGVLGSGCKLQRVIFNGFLG
jgi:hypothetical protein